MNSTSIPDQDAHQQGANRPASPELKGEELNGSPASTQQIEKPVLTDKLVNGSVKETQSTNDDTTPEKPETTMNNTTADATCPSDEETPVAKVLHFLATATPGSLAGVAVGFAAFTYLTMGRLGLVLIGAFGGVVGFISWEARNPEVSRAVRGERGIDVIERLLESRNNKTEEKAEDSSDDEETAIKNFDEFRPETREALGGLVDAVIRDYVKWWYSPIIPADHSFPLACRKTLTSYLLAVSNHLSRKRPADAFLDLLTNSSSIIIVFMSELASAFAELPPDSSMTAADAVYNYLAANPDCHLANLLNQRQQAAKFKMVAEDLLGFLDRNAYNCDPARVFLREILANSVLEKTLQTCSQADWINGWIVYLLEAGEPDLNQAIDVGMQRGPEATAATNVFADLDGNVGNVGIAKPGRSSLENERARRKEPLGHKKKLSKAEEEMDDAMEEMKRMNQMIAEEDARRKRESVNSVKGSSTTSNANKRLSTTGEQSPRSTAYGERSLPSATSTEGFSTKSDIAPTPITPRSPMDSSSPESSPKGSEGTRFTSFDQIVPPGQDNEEDEPPKKAPLTLHNASITLHDDATGDKSRIRTKPTWDYWVQVEPSVAGYAGWMIVRRYNDFETLHEILRRIANISGATAFTELHKDLPDWKVHTRESLRGELERYLRDACWYQSLAESEGMKRFLEKSKGHTHSESKSGFGWESMGKGMLDVLTTAPKGAMEGGKTLVGGVTGVFGNFPGLSRKTTSQSVDLTSHSSRLSISTPPTRIDGMRSPARSARDSMDSQRSSVVSTQPGKMPPMERRPSYQSQSESDPELRMSRADRKETGSASASARPSREHSRAPSLAQLRSPSSASLDFTKLPPPPDQIADDYGSPEGNGDMQDKMNDSILNQQHGRKGSQQIPTPPPSVSGGKRLSLKPARQYAQLSEPETRVAVELLFAVINEMYTLSSAWNIRRTLLTAAKSFLLRPGNPSLLTVQSLIQKSVIDANTSDAGLAHQLRKIRENMMPTEQELAAWPAELTADEKEKLRVKARRLLIQSGLPAALMGVMGQAATGEALGRVFDCLQIEEVARGLLFGLILQVVRIVTH
ncbi:PXA domain-containing protein [Fusarium falciforme]|uniref:PXA domain-containing protein n=1 Tax=Fusarium falciforme TaxID=195108 RepID=UPI00230051D7|nr:PXA domain-containing protein [Fusarium falciforme]WAO89613.1 PXA domain-containing protein [Fusarium falciforme]